MNLWILFLFISCWIITSNFLPPPGVPIIFANLNILLWWQREGREVHPDPGPPHLTWQWGGEGGDYQDKFLTCQSRYLERQALDVAPTHCYWLVSSPLGSLYEYSASICISFVSNINTRIQNIWLGYEGTGDSVFPSSAFLHGRCNGVWPAG